MSSETNLLSEFRDLIKKRNFGALEERWIAAIEGGSTGPSELEAFLDAADALLNASERSRADVLLDMTIPAVESGLEPPRLLELLRRRLRAAPDDSESRARFAKCFLDAYGAGSVEAEYLRLSNLEKAPDLEKALRLLDRWMRFAVGAFVHHGSGWGAGQVQSLDPILKQAVVQLEKKPNHRMSLEAMGSVLEPLADDHFWVLQYQGKGRIQELIDGDPVALVDLLLRSFGNPLTLKEIKLYLTPQYIPSSSWAKWWNAAKKRMRQKGFYRVEDKAPYRVEWVREEISYEAELLKNYRAEKDWAKRQTLAKKILKEEGKQNAELREAVVADLQRTLETGSGAQAVFAAYLLDRFVPSGEALMPQALRSCADPVKAITELDGPDEQRLALAALPALVGDHWPQAALELFSAGSDAVRDAIFARMAEDRLEELLTRKITSVMAGPRLSADLFTWCVRKVLDGQQGEIFAAVAELSPLALLQLVLDLLEYLAIRCERESDAVMREVLNRSRGVLAFKSHDLFRRALAGIDFEQGRELYKRLLSSLGLHDHVRVALLEIVTKTMPELTRPKDKPFWDDDDSIYVTPDGLQKRQEELRDLMEEKLPKNFQDIGRAASFGDLRENAEYKAALEQRDFLTAKATEIRAEVTRALPIEAGMLKPGEVTLGSRVSLENVANGRKSVYRILGPWDGGPDEGVLSYMSPLARAFLGARVGQEVEVKLPGSTESYRIMAVEPGIDA